jgi:hypothetical protein
LAQLAQLAAIPRPYLRWFVHLTGYVQSPRLTLGKKHIVLCKQERLAEALALIAATQSPAPRTIDPVDGVPEGWIALADVIPAEGYAFVQGAGNQFPAT